MSKYKVGDKFIFEIESVNHVPRNAIFEDIEAYDVYKFKNCTMVFTDKCFTDLERYTEEKYRPSELDRFMTEAYESGRNEAWEKAFEAGMNDAWELARKMCLGEEYGGLNDVEYYKAFADDAFETVLVRFTAQEAKTKIESSKKKKTEQQIKVGDVVFRESPKVYAVVTKFLTNEQAYLLFADGSCGIHDLKHFKKTNTTLEPPHFFTFATGGVGFDKVQE